MHIMYMHILFMYILAMYTMEGEPMNTLQLVNGTAALTLPDFKPDYFTSWTQYLDASPKTIETYTRAIRQFYKYMLTEGIDQPDRSTIIAYRAKLLAEKKPTTTQAYIIAVKLFFAWTAQAGLYPNIAEHIKGAKLDTEHKRDYLTSAQAARLLNSIDRTTASGKRDYALIALMLTSGIRTIEAARANIEDIRPLGDYTALFIQGKGHSEKGQYVKLAAPVEEAIADYLKTRRGADAAEPLFTSTAHRNTGDRLTTKSISRIVKNHLRYIGLDSERLTAHSLRHTAATLNLLNGGTPEETQQLLRHKNLNTTMIYSHALERANNNSESRIAEAIFTTKTE